MSSRNECQFSGSSYQNNRELRKKRVSNRSKHYNNTFRKTDTFNSDTNTLISTRRISN